MRHVLWSALFYLCLAQAQAEYISLTLSNRYALIKQYRMEYLELWTWNGAEHGTESSMHCVEQDQKLDQRQHFVVPLGQPALSYGIFAKGATRYKVQPLWSFAPGVPKVKAEDPKRGQLAIGLCEVTAQHDRTAIEDFFFQKSLFDLTAPTNDPVKTDSGLLVYELANSKGHSKVAVNPVNQTVAWIHSSIGEGDVQTDYSDYRETTAGFFPYQIKITVVYPHQQEGHGLIRINTFQPNPPASTLLPFKIPFLAMVLDNRFKPGLKYLQGTKQYTDEELAKFAFDQAKGKIIEIGYLPPPKTVTVPPLRWTARIIIIVVAAALIILPLLVSRYKSNKSDA